MTKKIVSLGQAGHLLSLTLTRPSYFGKKGEPILYLSRRAENFSLQLDNISVGRGNKTSAGGIRADNPAR